MATLRSPLVFGQPPGERMFVKGLIIKHRIIKLEMIKGLTSFGIKKNPTDTGRAFLLLGDLYGVTIAPTRGETRTPRETR